MTTQPKVVTARGIIYLYPKPVEKDIAKVLLVTDDGSEYPILHKGAGVDLIDQVNSTVEIIAVFENTPSLEEGKALKVRSYLLIDDEDYTWYDNSE